MQWHDGKEAINHAGYKKLGEVKDQGNRHEEYIKWHIKKYGRPPNPNFFRGVSPSNSRSGSNSSKGS